MKGSCLCGKVVYEITPPFKMYLYCHCSRCRKFTGSAHASNLIVPSSQFQWLQGQVNLESYDHPDAKVFATCFCKQCGSSLPWEVKGRSTIVVPAGTLDEDPGIKPQTNIFCGSKVAWFNSTSDLSEHEEFPV